MKALSIALSTIEKLLCVSDKHHLLPDKETSVLSPSILELLLGLECRVEFRLGKVLFEPENSAV